MSKIKLIPFILLGWLIASVRAQYKVIGYYAVLLKGALPAGKVQFETII